MIKTKKLIPIPKLLKKAQDVVNRKIRETKGMTCISCGKEANQAGHYLPVKQFSGVRFTKNNIWPQCAYCNCYAHGNQAMYRIGLVKIIGESAVKELEEIAIRTRRYKWTRDELIDVIKTH